MSTSLDELSLHISDGEEKLASEPLLQASSSPLPSYSDLDNSGININTIKKSSNGFDRDHGYEEMRISQAVAKINKSHDILMKKYGHIVNDGCCNSLKRVGDSVLGIIVFFLLLLPLLLFWLLIFLVLFVIYILFCKYQKYSYPNFIRLFIGTCRLKLLKSETKSGLCYSLFDRIIGFAQLVELGYKGGKFELDHLFDSYESVFSNAAGESEAFPLGFTITQTNLDLVYKELHKPRYYPSKENDSNPMYLDRQEKALFSGDTGSFLGLIGGASLFNLADGRHDIARKIVQIMCDVESEDEYTNFDKHYEKLFAADHWQLPQNTKEWIAKYVTHSNIKKNDHNLYAAFYATLFYRMFGYQMENDEMDRIALLGNANALASATPDWFSFLLLNYSKPRATLKIIDEIAKILETKCKDNIKVQKILEYGKSIGIKESRAVLYMIGINFLVAGGNRVMVRCYNRFINNPKYEYDRYMNNKKLYLFETLRFHPMVQVVSNICYKPVSFRIRGKYHTFPAGTQLGNSIRHTNLACPVLDGHSRKHVVPRRAGKCYEEYMPFQVRDGYFNSGSVGHLNQRFCVGRMFVVPHLIDILDIMYDQLKEEFCFDDNDNDPTNNDINVQKDVISNKLSRYNVILLKGLVSGLKKHNASKINDRLPDPIDEKEFQLRQQKQEQLVQQLVKQGAKTKQEKEDGMFGLKFLKEDLYVSRQVLKDTVFDVITKLKWIFPIEDDPAMFDSRNFENSRKIMKMFMRENAIMPKTNVEWTSLKSDDDISKFAFGGIICNYTKLITNENKDNLTPNNAKYMCDGRFLSQFQVRRPLEKYGACAYFDENFSLISIYVSHLESMIYSGSQRMKYAKYVWITTLVACITIKDHALDTHMLEANALVRNVYKHLPCDHWLRRLLTIFTYRTIYINLSLVKILLPKHGLVHRVWVSGFDG